MDKWILEQGFFCKENTQYGDILHPDILPVSIICRYCKPQSAYRVMPSGPSKSAVLSSTVSTFLVARSSVATHVFKHVRKAHSSGNECTSSPVYA